MPIAVAPAMGYLYQQQCTEASDTTAIKRQQPQRPLIPRSPRPITAQRMRRRHKVIVHRTV
jgi:hypothetical protein